MIRRADRASRAGTEIRVRRIGAVVTLASRSARSVITLAAGEVERGHGQDQPGAVRGEHPGRQVRERAVLEVGVDQFDDRVAAVGLVRLDSVHRVLVGCGEERDGTGRRRTGWAAPAAGSAWGCVTLPGVLRRVRPSFPERNAVNATSALEIQSPVA